MLFEGVDDVVCATVGDPVGLLLGDKVGGTVGSCVAVVGT